MQSLKQERNQFLFILCLVFLSFIGISMPYLIFPSLFFSPITSIIPSDWGDVSRSIFLGITLAAYPFGQFIGSPILGSLSDDYGRKPLMVISLLIAAICNLFSAFAIGSHLLSVLILSRFFTGVMEGNVAIARAMAADLKTIPKTKSLGRVNAAISFAYLLGPLIGGVLSDKEVFGRFQASSPFYIIFVLFLILFVLSIFILPSSKTVSIEGKMSFVKRLNLFQRIPQLFQKAKHLKWLILSSTFFTLGVDIFYEFGPVYLTLEWLFSPAKLVIYSGVLCIGLVLGNGWLSSLFFSDQKAKLPAVSYSIALLGLFLLFMTFTHSNLMMLFLFFTSGIVIGIVVTLLTVKISDAAPDQAQGEALGVQVSLRVLGDALICLFGGVLLAFSGKSLLIGSALISFLTLIYYVKNAPR